MNFVLNLATYIWKDYTAKRNENFGLDWIKHFI